MRLDSIFNTPAFIVISLNVQLNESKITNLVDGIEITVLKKSEVPDDGECQPAEEEPGCEEEEDPSPVEIDQRNENVFEELVLLPVGRAHRVQESIFSDDSILRRLTRQNV